MASSIQPECKVRVFQAFIQDPESLSSLTVEAEYEEMAEKSDESEWVELPLAELYRMYQTPEEKEFLETEVVGKQLGRTHPQDSTGENKMMKLYWVYRMKKDLERNSKRLGHRLRAIGEVPDNRAAINAIAEHMNFVGADFGGKSKGKSGLVTPPAGKAKGKGTKGKGGGKTENEPVQKKRAKKAGTVNLMPAVCVSKTYTVHVRVINWN